MKSKSETIIYCEFYDHSSSTNSWQTYEELDQDLRAEKNIIKVCGKIYKEDALSFKLITMWGDDCCGSGHLILKSTILREIRWEVPFKTPKKPILKTIQ